jgi:hypothetical protein
MRIFLNSAGILALRPSICLMTQGDRVPSFCETDKRVSIERLRQGNGHGLYPRYQVSVKNLGYVLAT